MANERCAKCGEPLTDFNRGGELVFDCHYDPKDCRIAELERLLEEAKTESVNRLARIVALEDLEKRENSICPMCANSWMHTHTPEEVMIFKNGRKSAAIERDQAISALNEVRSERDALRAELEAAKARPCVEMCVAERSRGRGGCGACALCCKEATQQLDAALAQVAVLREALVDLKGCMDGDGDPNSIFLGLDQAEKALFNTSAIAQETVQRIERETLEKADANVRRILRDAGRSQALIEWVSAAILGEKEKG